MSQSSALDDADFLRIVQAERVASIGFNHDTELNEARATALNYYKGRMDDMPSLSNRSRAMSTDVSDAVETLLPDLVDIFTGGDDVAVFNAEGPEDEDAARRETDLVNHVVFQQNNGFLALTSMFKDALLSKVGVIKVWWEEEESEDEEVALSPEHMLMARLSDPEAFPDAEPNEDATGWTATNQRVSKPERVCIQAVPPEDFTVARDTVVLSKATYCAMRSRPRAQALIDQGYDRDDVERLPPVGLSTMEEQQARDTADESDDFRSSTANGELRTVEIIEHFIRVDGDGDGKSELWRVVTGANENVLLEREQVDAIPFAAVTPYIVTHRFYGRSVADLVIEIQRIKTALLRMMLDSGYFALNQRLTVDMTKTGDFTISDLLRNEPGVPIRTKGAGAIEAIQSGGLGFDVHGALEYASTMAEQRTGIVRNAQGLNPDTLHDTASGALALMSNAQRRMRMIARIFAETGVKDLFLLVHRLLRKHATRPVRAKITGGWQSVDPQSFPERDDMTVQVGVGAGGRDHDLMAMGQAKEILTNLIDLQGGQPNGPFVREPQVYAFAKWALSRVGIKNAESYISDPDQQQQQPQGQPAPDPAVLKAQADQQQAQAKLQQDGQLAAQKLQQDRELAEQRLAAEMQLERYKADQNMELQREQIAADAQLERMKIAAQAQTALLTQHREPAVEPYVARRPGDDIGGHVG